MITGELPLSHLIAHYGCIHNLERECSILNEVLGDCSIEDNDLIVWQCKFYRCNVYTNEK
jgi:hypothetical protein